ncbi:MAG: hypothetical protein RIS34_1998 [Pseudomonadota bacterium]|jgi:Smg protein
MFEVLVFVYENYWRGDACPEWEHLERKLNLVGFEAEEIQEALTWLTGLSLAAQGSHNVGQGGKDGAGEGTRNRPELTTGLQLPELLPPQATALPPSANSMRVYSIAEQDHLGSECLGFVSFLESAGVLPAHMREIVMDRAMAAPGDPVCLDDLKIIVLMVYWSLGEEPDALVLDELCDDTRDRVAH